MVSVAERMEKLLVAHFAPTLISIMDDSAKHAGHSGARVGGESHFTVRIVSNQFVGKNKVARHREVYVVLQPLFDEGLHALALNTQTPDEAN